MFKSMKLFVLTSIILGVLSSVFFSVTVNAEEIKEPEQTEQVKKLADELEYIFTELYTVNDSGKVVANENNLEKSSYSDDDKIIIKSLVDQINDEPTVETRHWVDTVESCLVDGKKIGKALAKEIGNDIKKNNYIAAALKLAGGLTLLSNKEVSVTLAITFIALCGATQAS